MHSSRSPIIMLSNRTDPFWYALTEEKGENGDRELKGLKQKIHKRSIIPEQGGTLIVCSFQ